MSVQAVQSKSDNTQRERVITRAQLPLHCPMDADSTWSSHPRVFLDIAATGHARCPYCGTEYTLKDHEGA